MTDNTEAIEILKIIVEDKGSCLRIGQGGCETCPLSRLKKKENGTYYSCFEAVMPNIANIPNPGPGEVMKAYHKAAKEKLIDILIEEAFLKESGED